MPLFDRESPEVYSSKFVRVKDEIHITEPNQDPSHYTFAINEGIFKYLQGTDPEIQDEDLDAGRFYRAKQRVLFTSASSTLMLPLTIIARNRSAEIFVEQNPEFQAFTREDDFNAA